MLDMAGTMVRYLRSVGAVSDIVDDRVYAELLVPDVVFPAVRIQVLSVVSFAPPTNHWDNYQMQADCWGEENGEATAIELADTVRQAIHDMTGVHGDAAIVNTEQAGTYAGLDESVGPALPRWIVTVNVTARRNI